MDPEAPLILTALLDDATQAELDALRRRHFPAQRNHLAAHVTLFHHLAPSARGELDAALRDAARSLPLGGRTGAPFSLGRGVAIAIDCPGLVALRRGIAAALTEPLTRQDAGWGRPHATVQNKVQPAAAKGLLATLRATLAPRELEVVGLGLWRYLGGPWEALARIGPNGVSEG